MPLTIQSSHLLDAVWAGEKEGMIMLFPVMQYETKYGIDFRVGASERNIRSGSLLVGYLEENSNLEARRALKTILLKTLYKNIYPKG